MKKLFTLLGIVCSLCLTSCLSTDESPTQYLGAYFTITGYGSNYVLYSDGDSYTIYVDPSSLPSSGMDVYKRGYFTIQYNSNDMTTDAKGNVTIQNGQIVGGRYIGLSKTMTKDEATAKNVNAADSVYMMKAISDAWYSRGYITAAIQSNYFVADNGSYIVPTFTVIADDESISANAITYNVLSNRHPQTSKSEYGPSGFDLCFDATSSLARVPGSDSIKVTIVGDGLTGVTLKVGRK